MLKHQIPSIKFQTNPNDRNSKSQTNRFGYLNIWIWNLFGIWSLGFGISNQNTFLVQAAVATEMAEGFQ
jgi:hypothetical protein